MSELSLDELRDVWIQNHTRDQQFTSLLETRIRRIIRASGIWGRIQSRTKEVDSLLRNHLKNPQLTYEKLWEDVSGVRIVVRFHEQVQEGVGLLRQQFLVRREKEIVLPPEEVGYQGYHCIVALRSDDPDIERYGRCVGEVQIRTLSQDLWSEMAHDLSYKSVVALSRELARRVNILSGVIELADQEFSRLNNEITDLPGYPELKILVALERQYWKLSAKVWDKAFATEVIRVLRPLYGDMSSGEWTVYFDKFYQLRKADLEFIFKDCQEDETRSLFLFQPGVLMIFDKLSSDPERLHELWRAHFPESELHKLATVWGVSLA